MSVILHYNYNFFKFFFFFVSPFWFYSSFLLYRHESVCNPVLVALPGEMRGTTSAGPPSPSAGGEEQREEGSGKCVGLAGSGKKASFLGGTG